MMFWKKMFSTNVVGFETEKKRRILVGCWMFFTGIL